MFTCSFLCHLQSLSEFSIYNRENQILFIDFNIQKFSEIPKSFNKSMVRFPKNKSQFREKPIRDFTLQLFSVNVLKLKIYDDSLTSIIHLTNISTAHGSLRFLCWLSCLPVHPKLVFSRLRIWLILTCIMPLIPTFLIKTNSTLSDFSGTCFSKKHPVCDKILLNSCHRLCSSSIERSIRKKFLIAKTSGAITIKDDRPIKIRQKSSLFSKIAQKSAQT